MCGITAGVAQRDVAPILIEGLKRLEYRGYDSAGLAVVTGNETIERLRVCGKVQQLSNALKNQFISGQVGVAHTRWATHGKPSELNAHPHMHEDSIALVHNGIIENHLELKQALLKQGITFTSDTDSEVIVKLLGTYLVGAKDLVCAVQETIKQLKGAFALAVVSKQFPDRVVAAKVGSPLVIGLGIGEHFLASDPLALYPVAQDFVVLEEGDVAEVFASRYQIFDKNGTVVSRSVHTIDAGDQWATRGEFRHFMQKEIFEQPESIYAALQGRISDTTIDDAVFGVKAQSVFDVTQRVKIIACGTSFHAALVAKYWLEGVAQIACDVEIASEMRYRSSIVSPKTLLVALSQSGETADTLAAFGVTSTNWSGRLAICNVPQSSLVRASDLVFLTHAGPEIGVASTKAFTAQLVGLLMLVYCLAKRHSKDTVHLKIPSALRQLPVLLKKNLALDSQIESLANEFESSAHAIFLGRGVHYPIALEGALKLKEISYIHAEAYPAGELKHGPLALVDKHMPVVAIVPNNELLHKIKSNLQEVAARGGKLILFVEEGIELYFSETSVKVINLPSAEPILSPILSTVSLQLLAYHVAVTKGTDVDQPRNLAKSVTVE